MSNRFDFLLILIIFLSIANIFSDVKNISPKPTFELNLIETPIFEKPSYTYAKTKRWEMKNCTNPSLPNQPVVVLDTGLDTTHVRFKNRLYNKLSSRFIASMKDVLWHGTHVTGIMFHYSQFSSPIKVIPFTVFSNNIFSYKNFKRAIKYSIRNKIKIINFSLVGYKEHPEERSLILEAHQNGILFIASAGNDNKNLNNFKIYPVSYNLPNMISVGNINNKGVISKKSNYGNSVHVFAEGVDISSAQSGTKDGISESSGTSQSAPFVTRLVACLWANNPDLTHLEIKKRILSGEFLNAR